MTVRTRSYNQACSVARALEILGDRWTLLIIRDLLCGPKRYKDLLAYLPGIGRNLLAARLKMLKEVGVIRQILLPPPADVRVYELTDLGRELKPTILSLSRWGTNLPAENLLDMEMRPEWLLLSLEQRFDPESACGLTETYEFRIDGEVFHADVADGTIDVTRGSAASPACVIEADSLTILKIGAAATRKERERMVRKVKFTGDPEAFRRCIHLF